MIFIIIVCVIIIGFLGFRLYKKQQIDQFELEHYKSELEQTKLEWERIEKDYHQVLADYNTTKSAREYEEHKLDECKKDLQVAMDNYHDMVDNKIKNIDASIEEQRKQREQELENEFNTKLELQDRLIYEKTQQVQEEINALTIAADEERRKLDENTQMYQREVQYWEKTWLSILEPIKRYEKTKQQRLFYTIQLPEEYQEDIEFLLTTVAAKVQHPDIISKLVWAEYVKPYLDDTFKRIEIKAEPGIYKLTNINNNKSYIGKSTNVKTRIADHFKSSVGIKSIADQAVHHAILKDGFWNWQIEVLTYCDKEELSEKEKYYIGFFKTQEFGYNKTGGG